MRGYFRVGPYTRYISSRKYAGALFSHPPLASQAGDVKTGSSIVSSIFDFKEFLKKKREAKPRVFLLRLRQNLESDAHTQGDAFFPGIHKFTEIGELGIRFKEYTHVVSHRNNNADGRFDTGTEKVLLFKVFFN
jgi:hypothetical protein